MRWCGFFGGQGSCLVRGSYQIPEAHDPRLGGAAPETKVLREISFLFFTSDVSSFHARDLVVVLCIE